MKKYALPITFFLFLFSFSLAVYAAESETEIEGSNIFLGDHGVFAKECKDSQYIVTLARCGCLCNWTSSLLFWPPSQNDGLNLYIAKFSVTCSKEDYEKLEMGDYVDCAGFYDFPPDDFKAGIGELTEIRKNCGPMVYDPDGLILWLYRDLPEE